jgi:Secretion system C-terminal sorting domain
VIVSHYDDQPDLNTEHLKSALTLVDLTTGVAGASTSISYSDSLTVFNDLLLNGTTLLGGGSTWTTDGQRDILIAKWDVVTAIREMTSASNLRVYPNPAENDIHVRVMPEDIGGTMHVYHSTGALITSFRIQSTDTRLPVENWPAGVYLIHIETNNNNVKTSFIKK